MSKKELVNTYTQVLLTRKDGDSTMHTVCWLPTQFTKLGKTIQLKDPDTKEFAEEIWTVVEKYSTKTADYVEDRAEDYKNHRKFSDI